MANRRVERLRVQLHDDCTIDIVVINKDESCERKGYSHP